MLPDRVSNLGPLDHESDALPTALRGPAKKKNLILSKLLTLTNLSSISAYSLDSCRFTPRFPWALGLSVENIFGFFWKKIPALLLFVPFESYLKLMIMV